MTLHTLLADVATHLGDGWSADTEKDWLHGPDGARLYVREETYGSSKGKWSISGGEQHLPGYEYSNHGHLTSRVSINVSPSRGAKVVAGEITRRLLPEYLDALHRVREAIARTQSAEAARKAVVAQLLTHPVTKEWGEDKVRCDVPGAYGYLTVNYNGDGIDFDLKHVPLDVAFQVVALLDTIITQED